MVSGRYNLTAHLDEHNTGVLIVNLSGNGSRSVSHVLEMQSKLMEIPISAGLGRSS